MASRVVAIVGATGLLGRALVAAFRERPDWTVRSLGHQEIEVTDRESVARALEPVPDVVINSTLGDWSRQEDVEFSWRINALGPRLLAERCAAVGAYLVQVSTDYVFEGKSDAPYGEGDPTEPRSIYGITKLAGEHLVRSMLPRHLVLRVAYVFGPGGSRAKRGTDLVTTLLGLARGGGPVRLVTDQVFSPTYAPDAARTVVELVEAGITGTAHVTNRGQCTPYELGQRIFAASGLRPEIVPIRLADLPPGPHRPRYSVLAHGTLGRAGMASPRPWAEALDEYLVQTAP